MTPSPDRIRADVARVLQDNGLPPKAAVRAAIRLVRGLALSDRPINADRIETLTVMRDRIEELLLDNIMDPQSAESAAMQIIDWLRRSWGSRTLTRQWWGFGSQAASMEMEELIQVESDPVRSRRGRQLRAVVWGILVQYQVVRICRVASDIAAMVETDWAGVYVPKGDELDRQERDKAVYKAFGGLGSIERVTALGVSQSTAYDIYKRLEAAKNKREQPGLPGVERDHTL